MFLDHFFEVRSPRSAALRLLQGPRTGWFFLFHLFSFLLLQAQFHRLLVKTVLSPRIVLSFGATL